MNFIKIHNKYEENKYLSVLFFISKTQGGTFIDFKIIYKKVTPKKDA